MPMLEISDAAKCGLRTDGKWRLLRSVDKEKIILARIETLEIKQGFYYDIKPFRIDGFGTCSYVSVQGFDGDKAICKVSSVDKRRPHATAKWHPDFHKIPLLNFIQEAS